MNIILADNVEDAFLELRNVLASNLFPTHPSRNGDVTYLGPVTTTYLHPQERFLLLPEREANPIFHVAEAMWMLAGRNDVAPMAALVKSMAKYSDNGATFNGAYGFRWRRHFGYDQVEAAIQELRQNPTSRRVIIQMWDPVDDGQNQSSRDLCCNLSVKFDIVAGRLNMYVLNRSNDMVFGAYGANAVHFSYLQEYVAAATGTYIGEYEQVSLNAHVYDASVYGDRLHALVRSLPTYHGSRYAKDGGDGVVAVPFVTLEGTPFEVSVADGLDLLAQDLAKFDLLDISSPGFSSAVPVHPFFQHVVSPMLTAYRDHKDGHTEAAVDRITNAISEVRVPLDALVAAQEWFIRRLP